MKLETYKELVFSQTKEPSVTKTKWATTSPEILIKPDKE